MTNILKVLVVSLSLIGCAAVTGDKPGAIVLQNLDGEHLGFTLFHPNFLELSGDCVFVIVPKTVEIYESEVADYLLTMREKGEFQWSRNKGLVTVSRGGSSYLAYQSDGKLVNLQTGKAIGSWKTTKN